MTIGLCFIPPLSFFLLFTPEAADSFRCTTPWTVENGCSSSRTLPEVMLVRGPLVEDLDACAAGPCERISREYQAKSIPCKVAQLAAFCAASGVWLGWAAVPAKLDTCRGLRNAFVWNICRNGSLAPLLGAGGQVVCLTCRLLTSQAQRGCMCVHLDLKLRVAGVLYREARGLEVHG